MKIDGTAAVVTGAASGLGEATARALAAKGAKVAVFDRDADKGEKVAAEIGGIFCEVDVTSDEKVAAAFEKARAAHGQERILVNCAGVANAAKTVGRDKETKRRSVPYEPVRAGDRHQSGRHLSLHRLLRSAWSRPRRSTNNERGVIINTASVARRTARSARLYSASRAACSPWRCRSRAT